MACIFRCLKENPFHQLITKKYRLYCSGRIFVTLRVFPPYFITRVPLYFLVFFIIIIIIMFVSEIFLCEFLSNGHLIYQESPANRKKITKKLKDIRLHNRITMYITLRTSPSCFITQVSIFPFSIMKNMFLINYKHCIFSSFTTSK